MSYENVLYEVSGAVCQVTVNRPDQLNALNRQTIQELSDALKAADADKNIRAIIVTGSGEKAFVAGADIKEFANYSVEEGQQLSQDGQDKLFNMIEQLGTPCIAAINGFALGGGLELALSCHIRIASDNARMGLPEVSLGVIPGYGGTQRLAQLVGRGRALEMITTAGMVKADAAHSMGLVNHVTIQDELINKANEIAGAIVKNSPTAIRHAIKAVNAGYAYSEDGLKTEVEEFGKSFGSNDFKEGTTAFVEKRTAEFTGD